MITALSFRPVERLKKRAQFQKVYKKGRPAKEKNFMMLYLETGSPYNRIGFSVTAKKMPRANRRAKVKRFLREAYRHNKCSMKKGYDIVIIAEASAKDLGYKETAGEMCRLFKKAGLTLET